MSIELKEPNCIKELVEQSAQRGPVSLSFFFYERALRLVNNMSGNGEVYDAMEKNGIPSERSVVMPRGAYASSIYRTLPTESITPQGGAEIVTFDSSPDLLEDIEKLRKLIPPTLATPLAENLVHRLTQDTPKIQEGNRKAREFLREIGINQSSESCQAHQITRDHIRKSLLASCGFNENDDLSVFRGADEALVMATHLLIAETREETRITMPKKEYYRYVRLAKLLKCQVSPLPIRYDNPKKTEIDQRSDVVYISNPNNPLGLMLEPEQIRELITKMPEGATLIVDMTGTTHDFSQREYIDSMKNVMQMSGNRRIILVGSMSKEEHAPWLRIGWAYSNNSETNNALKAAEIGISPIVGRAFDNRMKWAEENDLRRASRQYMSDFYRKLQEVAKGKPKDIHLCIPKEAKEAGMKPSGYFCTIEFADPVKQNQFDESLKKHCADEFKTNLGLPTRGNQENGMPKTTTRLCATGPAFQINALIETLY